MLSQIDEGFDVLKQINPVAIKLVKVRSYHRRTLQLTPEEVQQLNDERRRYNMEQELESQHQKIQQELRERLKLHAKDLMQSETQQQQQRVEKYDHQSEESKRQDKQLEHSQKYPSMWDGNSGNAINNSEIQQGQHHQQLKPLRPHLYPSTSSQSTPSLREQHHAPTRPSSSPLALSSPTSVPLSTSVPLLPTSFATYTSSEHKKNLEADESNTATIADDAKSEFTFEPRETPASPNSNSSLGVSSTKPRRPSFKPPKVSTLQTSGPLTITPLSNSIKNTGCRPGLPPPAPPKFVLSNSITAAAERVSSNTEGPLDSVTSTSVTPHTTVAPAIPTSPVPTTLPLSLSQSTITPSRPLKQNPVQLSRETIEDDSHLQPISIPHLKLMEVMSESGNSGNSTTSSDDRYSSVTSSPASSLTSSFSHSQGKFGSSLYNKNEAAKDPKEKKVLKGNTILILILASFLNSSNFGKAFRPYSARAQKKRGPKDSQMNIALEFQIPWNFHPYIA